MPAPVTNQTTKGSVLLLHHPIYKIRLVPLLHMFPPIYINNEGLSRAFKNRAKTASTKIGLLIFKDQHQHVKAVIFNVLYQISQHLTQSSLMLP